MFSDRLKQLRKEKNWSQQELATKLDITQGMVGHYESGLKHPSSETLIKIARLFQVSLDYLVGLSKKRGILDEEELKEDPDLMRIVSLMRPKIKGVSVSDDQWDLITTFLQSVVKQLEAEGRLPKS